MLALYREGESHPFKVLYCGDERPLAKIVEQCDCVTADGDELASIHENYDNVPWSKGCRVMTWYGDMAKFIIANWF